MSLVGQNDFSEEGLALDPGSLGCHSTVQHPKICIYQAKRPNNLSLLLAKVLP